MDYLYCFYINGIPRYIMELPSNFGQGHYAPDGSWFYEIPEELYELILSTKEYNTSQFVKDGRYECKRLCSMTLHDDKSCIVMNCKKEILENLLKRMDKKDVHLPISF